MNADAAALASATSTLEEVGRRIIEVAGRYADTERDEVAVALYEVERSLRTASRRLDKVVDRLG